ncbi:MAG: RNA polymerase sigma factor [Candidatus Aminicenantes bacterium]|nr:RNA polymerase sigma factor [Candidatus Aminicenantes bacterium]
MDDKTAGIAPDISVLMARVKEGNKNAFQDITRRYQQKIFVLAYSFFRNREDALDIVQETFLRLYEKAGLFREGEDFKAWLFQIARNLCIDSYRRNRNRRNDRAADLRLEDLPSEAGDPADSERRADLRALFRSVLDKLAEKQRAVFVMKHYNDMPYLEIARTLEIALGTVKSLHFKAVRNLRKHLGPHMGMTS